MRRFYQVHKNSSLKNTPPNAPIGIVTKTKNLGDNLSNKRIKTANLPKVYP